MAKRAAVLALILSVFAPSTAWGASVFSDSPAATTTPVDTTLTKKKPVKVVVKEQPKKVERGVGLPRLNRKLKVPNPPTVGRSGDRSWSL